MFKQLIDALRKKDALGEMFARFEEMLGLGHGMFSKACDVVAGREQADAVGEELYRCDRRINQLERLIRERIVVHLVLGNEADIGVCLVLMSVVKDAERIGDYCKNLFQMAEQFQGTYTRGVYTGPLADLAEIIDGLFPQVAEAFSGAKKKQSKRTVAASAAVRKTCDLLVKQLLTPGGSATPDEAAALVMRARFFKRVAAHLGNIATSVGNPVPMLDYTGKKPLDEPET